MAVVYLIPPLGRLDPEENFPFPDPEASGEVHGLVALGGNLSPGMLLSAYRQGIFPWYSRRPIRWYSPDPRFVICPQHVRPSSSMRRILNKRDFTLTCDQAFDQVIEACARIHASREGATWITDEMIVAYQELHRLGYAHSVETWVGGELVGGLYGVSLGRIFFGESMFFTRPNASKIAFYGLIELTLDRGIPLIDSQVANAHVHSLGGTSIPRSQYLEMLADLVRQSPDPRPWRGNIDPNLPRLRALLQWPSP